MSNCVPSSQPHLNPPRRALAGGALVKGPADGLSIQGVENFAVVTADDLRWIVPQEIANLGVGEGKIAVTVEDVNEVRAALDQGSIARLRQSYILDRIALMVITQLLAQREDFGTEFLFVHRMRWAVTRDV